MRDKQTKGVIVQWLIPTIVLVIIVGAMLFDFSNKCNESAAENVEDKMVNIVREMAAEWEYEIKGMTNTGLLVGRLMEKSASNHEIAELAAALCADSDAYIVIYCDAEGSAITHNGNKINMSGLSYFPDIMDENTADMSGYIYAEDDELGISKSAIISMVPLNMGEEKKSKLLMYYPLENMSNLLKESEYDNTFYFLLNPDGTIMQKAGRESAFSFEENMWKALEQNTNLNYNDVMRRARVRMKNRATGSISAVVEKEARYLAYAPLKINNWSLVMGVSQNYTDRLQEKEWRVGKQMLYKLVVAILLFLGLVIVINIISRIKTSEKSKELEEKADTDLLTSLHNKVATERKIKEYIEKFPDEQGLMFVLDIDNFKKINDTLGHAFGDEVLRSLGHQIGVVFRATDVIGRTGGDEFTIFLKHLGEEELLEKEAQKLCTFFKNFQAGEYVKYAATASIGAAVYPRDGKSFESLYRAADMALYKAKKQGKNQLVFYGEEEQKSEGKKRVEEESKRKE